MWIYEQSTGKFRNEDGAVLATCYAGNGEGLNNPAMQNQPMRGPLPQGFYTMTKILDSPHTGKRTIILEPDPTNQMFGRDLFRIHGDNAAANHTASDGCIIMGGAAARQHIWDGGDHRLQVIA